MADFPEYGDYPCGVINTWSSNPACVELQSAGTAAVWPAANLAMYVPIVIQKTVTITKMAVEITTQAGNLDLGIYDEAKNRLVSIGSTAVGAAGIQIVDITDTTLRLGTYFIGICLSSGSAAIRANTANNAALQLQAFGMQQQAVGAVTLPDPAVFANPGQAYIPYVTLAIKSTI